LPAIAGPILLVLALQHGPAFAGKAATGTLLGIVALIVFVLVFAWVGKRQGGLGLSRLGGDRLSS
jgi:hypothetical protein